MSASVAGCSLLLCAATLLLLGLTGASDVNWGKKVSCFVVEGTVVCPGCNYRAGLSCPRKLKNSQNCLVSSTASPRKKAPTKAPLQTTPEETTTVTEPTLLTINLTTQESNEIQKESTKEPIDLAIYLYRLLGPRVFHNRSKRELQQIEEENEEKEEEPEICNWNGDCPCPQICCKTGPGCPKRCVMGIRLPPPWG